MSDAFENVTALLAARDPEMPVYCVYPHIYQQSTRHFVKNFPGRTLYAVKANNHPDVIRQLYWAGVRHFDCASLGEIELVSDLCPTATMYFMNPVRLPGHAKIAHRDFGVRYFVIDHRSGLAPLVDEIDAENATIFARMAVSHESAMEDLSSKFGARPENIPELLTAIRASGAEPALAFNVGTGVTDPEAYAYAIDTARSALSKLDFAVRLLDIGGGFPRSYPGFVVPELDDFFERIAKSATTLPLANGGELLAEPGRALSAPGLSAITRVLLKKTDRIYINDGMYGAFWELRFKGHLQYACRVFRNGSPLNGETKDYRIFGPTCDSSDVLPARVALPKSIAVGDHIEFGSIGAYSLSGRTDFNGFYSDDVVSIVGDNSLPPS